MDCRRNLNSLIDNFTSYVRGKWHKERRRGNDGSAGNTLEDLLGIEENNLKLPDWGDFELKTKQLETQSLITLLHREPQPQGSVPLLLNSLGWRHQHAGTKYDSSEMSFRSTTRASKFSDRGLVIRLDANRINFIFDPRKVARTTRDRTNIYNNYGEWVDDVLNRKPNYKEVFPVYWDRTYIESEIVNKLNNTLFVTCKTRRSDGIREYRYQSAVLLSGFNTNKLEELFRNHSLFVDFDARTKHNHGTKFRVKVDHLPLLFDRSRTLI